MNGSSYDAILLRVKRDLDDGVLTAGKKEKDAMMLYGTGTGVAKGFREVMPDFLAGWLWASLEEQNEYLELSNEIRKERGLEVLDSFETCSEAAC